MKSQQPVASFRKNVLANYVGQFYVTLIGIVMVPLYVRYMGAEAYGLVGFFAMLQAWFQLLDMGLTPTMGRETARFNGGAGDAAELRRLLRTLEGIFWIVGICGAAAMIAGSGSIALHWLNVKFLPLDDVQRALALMALIIALRWVCGLYRSAISGFERMVWLSGFNIAMATARFVFVIPVFLYVGTGPTHFFGYQLLVAVVELAVLVVKTYRVLPAVTSKTSARWDWKPLRAILKFSLSIAFTSSVWVLVTQTDKLILSKLLPLADYAYFTLAVLVASGVMLISGPISAALLPRMAKLAAESDDSGLVRLYRNTTQIVGVITIPAAFVLAFFGEQVLWAWTGDRQIAHTAAPVLALYAAGNGFLAFGAFPYYLQFAKGDLKLHMLGNVLFVVLLVPTLIWSTLHFGVLGAGFAWFGANVVYFFTWVPLVHRRFVKDLHARWLLNDIGVTFLIALTGAAVLRFSLHWPDQRMAVGGIIGGISLALLTLAAAGLPLVRASLRRRWDLAVG